MPGQENPTEGCYFQYKGWLDSNTEEAFRNLWGGKGMIPPVFPVKKVINCSWPCPSIFGEQLFKSNQAKLEQLI